MPMQCQCNANAQLCRAEMLCSALLDCHTAAAAVAGALHLGCTLLSPALCSLLSIAVFLFRQLYEGMHCKHSCDRLNVTFALMRCT